MRSRIVAVVLALALALTAALLVGCGGGDDGVEQPTTTGEAPVTPPAPAGTAAAAPADRSPTETVVYEPFPTDPAITPEPVLQLLEAKQPMMVYFYDSTQKTTNDEAKGIDDKGGIEEIMSQYRGAIDLVSFDIGRFITTNPDGSITVDPAFAEDAAAQQAASLAAELGVTFTPYVVIVDGQGYIVGRFRGWDDYKDIEREVLRATS